MDNRDESPFTNNDTGSWEGKEDDADVVVEEASSQTQQEEVEEEEEEEECRVCRGPSEEGRPLFAPCKCSGSIGLVHQDCLMSWLEVTRGDGRCELCKTKFRFDPQYAENTPDTLPTYEVILGLSSRALAKWIPLGFRIIVAASLWLLVAPLLTTFLYHGWMHRPSSILTRWQTSLIPSDIVSGAIIAAIIIISFLSLMSFADFLRVHWQQQQQPRQDNNNIDEPRRNNDANGIEDEHNANEDDGGVDEVVVEKREALMKEMNNRDTVVDRADSIDQTDLNQNNARLYENRRQESENPVAGTNPYYGGRLILVGDASQNAGAPNGPPPIIPREEEEEDDAFHDDDDNDDDDDDDDDIEDEQALPIELNDNDDGPVFPDLGNNERNNRPFDPIDPGLQDDQVDMEINVALDELLGLRGPLSTLVRNLLWLLAFNATYLGIFAFLPKTVGNAVYTGILNTTTCDTILKAVPFMYSEKDGDDKVTMLSIIGAINDESSRLNTTFRLSTFATVTLGYFSMATIIVLMRYGWILIRKIRQKLSNDTQDTNPEPNGHAARLRRGQQNEERQMNAFDPDGVDTDIEASAVGAALDATVAVVKVGVLLFLKMFLLPLLLGLWLDASTTGLFGHTTADRIAFAGGDLFSFVLLHWVAGITFMLLVTVFLLQLREVAHPDLLARMIRPQEPQPDLLGNLMHETVTTHMKRMFLSLGIYLPLLAMHVTVPVKLFMASGLGKRFAFFHLNFWHILMPKLQIPLELIIFHLSMLALLERYKNSIGGLQHRWMVFMCRRMGLTEYMMPRSVSKFKLYGKREILSTSFNADSFFYELAGTAKDVDQLILSNVEKAEELRFEEGSSKENGQRILAESSDFIRLPRRSDSECTTGEAEKLLLPTTLGQFRLAIVKGQGTSLVVEFWQEIPGEEIKRPPVGWDDLGQGGAYVQGRWAWGNERKSTVEWSVAKRAPFKTAGRRPVHLMLKVVALLVLSWFAITLTVVGMFSAPLAVGRSLYHLFRVPPHYIHDPLAFCVGGCLVFPMISLVYKRFGNGQDSPMKHFRVMLSRLHAPPRQKLMVVAESLILWIVITPVALGASYEAAVVKSTAWFSREEPFVDSRSLLCCWLLGTVVLHTWAFLAYFGVFTTAFWTNIGNGILEPPIDENGAVGVGRNNMDAGNLAENNAAAGRGGAEMSYQPWQGKRGRVARFFNIWIAVFTSWDWDIVDRVPLIEEFARPIARQVASALVGSSVSYQFTLFAVPYFSKFVDGGVSVPFVGVIERGLLKLMLFRICMAAHVLVQLGSASTGRLGTWFQAAHDAARDDRYLIGEILMNYDPQGERNR